MIVNDDSSIVNKSGASLSDGNYDRRMFTAPNLEQGILKGEYHCTIDLLFDWFGLVCFANTKIVSCNTADFKPIKQVCGTVILSPLVFPA